MYKIIFFKNKNNISEVEDYLKKLQKKDDKDSKIKFNKIVAYINILSEYGVTAGVPYVKHLHENIWELRPIKDRILFSCLDNNIIILLNVFTKQSAKTPKSEINKAIRNLKDFRKRSEKDEKSTLWNLGKS